MTKRLIATLLISVAGGAFAQSAPAPAPAAAPKPVTVACDTCGTVQQVKQKEKKSKTSGVGMVGGAVVGGVLGNQIGGGSGRAAATVLGAVGGAVAGNKIAENQQNTYAGNPNQTVYRISVQTDTGQMRTYDVSATGDLQPGDRVRIDNGVIYHA